MTQLTSRWKVVESPTVLPGSCGVCGTEKGPFVDTGLMFDYFGALYICLPDVRDMGREVGLVDPVAENAPVEFNPEPGWALAQIKADLSDAIDSVLHNHSVYVSQLTIPLDLEDNSEPESPNSKELTDSGADDSTSSIKGSSGISSDSGSIIFN